MKNPTTINSKLNTLTGRCDFLKLPPPLTNVNISNSSTYKATIPALLHPVYTRVGRAALCICLAGLPLLMGSCEKEPLTDATTPDATRSLEPTDTTGTPSLGMVITINPEWEGQTDITY